MKISFFRLPESRSVSRSFTSGLAFALLVLAGSLPVYAQSEGRTPNIVFILTDDQAAWAVSGAPGAHPQARTPHIDRLIREGAYLRNAFVTTPVCSPSRAGLLTSRYGSELEITDWIHPRREPDLGLDPKTVTWAEVFQDAGYATGLVGKWHLGVPDPYHPTRQGYGYFMGFLEGGAALKDPVLEKDGKTQQIAGFTTEILTDEALAFIRRHREDPFLLSLHYRAPHHPWLPLPEEDWAAYRDLDPQIPNPDYPKLDADSVKTMMRQYLASVASVDRNVDRVLDLLDELGLSENTVVIFTSDHGYNMGHQGIWHKGNGHWVLTDPPPATETIPRGQRPNMYDHSLRVPAAVRWPGVVLPGAVVEKTITNLDWYPTLLAMAGLQKPDGVLMRGRNFLPLLQGENLEDWDNSFYAEYSTRHQSRTHMRMVRSPEWKLMRDFLNSGRDELYHLTVDPAEAANLIGSKDAEVRKAIERLDAKLTEQMRALKDPVLQKAETPEAP